MCIIMIHCVNGIVCRGIEPSTNDVNVAEYLPVWMWNCCMSMFLWPYYHRITQMHGESLSLSIVTTATFQCSFLRRLIVHSKIETTCIMWAHWDTLLTFSHCYVSPLQLVTLRIDPITESWTFCGNDHNHSISCPVIYAIDGGHLCKYGGGGGGRVTTTTKFHPSQCAGMYD